jgi:hypothetical protein
MQVPPRSERVSALEDVKEVIEYESHNLLNASASEGSRTVFNEEKGKGEVRGRLQ